jgi:hypothetical protein
MVPGGDLFEFTLDQHAPLTYCDGGHEWQPDRHMLTDRGSIPAVVSWIPGFDRNRLAYLFHDSAYTLVRGRGHGLYVRAAGFHEYVFRKLTRRQADDMMRAMLLVEGVPATSARMIWAAVRVFARRW